MGHLACAPGFGTIRSPKPAEGSASAGGSPSLSSHLPSLLESPLQSEVLPAESDGESCCKIELPTEQMDGEAETEADESRRLLFPSEQAAADGGADEAEKAEQDLFVTKGTRAMQLWLEGGAEGDVQGMGPRVVLIASSSPLRCVSFRHIQYCMNKVKLLRDNGVIPVLVFDGGKLPSKSQQESKRDKSRRENLERAEQLLLKGKRTEARECFQKAVDITPAIAHQLIK
ncbi:unnamed protein product, partial [Closterium sp. NIES-54]